ncbi:MAG: hypothetical protein IKZ67_06965, partial [Paludibacteraceae bacterium]|nr:hypothetical protein [Paludibacteraceae bacterium]
MAAGAQSVSDSISESNSSNQTTSSESYKPEEGSFMMEVGFAPFHSVIVDEEAGTKSNGSLVNLQGGLLRGVYVISDNLQLKLGFGLSIYKDVDDNGETG